MSNLVSIFTKTGDVYVGEKIKEYNYPNYTFLIPRTNINAYIALNNTNESDRFLELQKIGVAILNNNIAKILNGNEIPERKPTNFFGKTNPYQKQRKNMFIFGAGASAFCIYGEEKENYKNDTLKSPLGNELFDKRFEPIYRYFKGVSASLVNLRRPNLNVEEVLQEDWNEVEGYSNDTIMSNHINIQFYLQEVLNSVSVNIEKYEMNLFELLANKLQKISNRNHDKRFSFVSFNQDTILEQKLKKQFRVEYEDINDYINEDKYPFCIFKPHGSLNWSWIAENSEASYKKYYEILFENKTNYFDLYFKLLGNSDTMVDWSSYGRTKNLTEKAQYSINKDKLKLLRHYDTLHQFPAILLPYRDKDEFLFPNSHHDEMRYYLEETEALFIIGWKGNERLFNKVLKKNANKIKKVVIADPCADDVLTNLKDFLENKKIEIVTYNDFEDFVINGLEKELL